MIFTCEKEPLLREMLIAHDIISMKTTISVLSNVLLTAENNLLKITATDLKVSFSSNISIQMKQSGIIVCFCDRLLEILRSLPDGEIDFSLDENQVLLIIPRRTKASFKLKCMPADKFPAQHEIEEKQFFHFSQKNFIDMIQKTIYAISDDETRFFLNGVYFEKIDENVNMVASDGRRLSFIQKASNQIKNNFPGIIIPPKILNIVKKNASGEGDLLLAVTEKNIFIKIDHRLFSSSLVEGKFPNYQKIIPENNEYKVRIRRKALEESLKRVSVLIENKTRSILFQFSGRTLIVSSDESEIGKAQEEIECDYSGPELTIVFNYHYLLDPLRVIEDEMVEIEFNDPKRAIILRPQGNNSYFNIIMPLVIE